MSKQSIAIRASALLLGLALGASVALADSPGQSPSADVTVAPATASQSTDAAAQSTDAAENIDTANVSAAPDAGVSRHDAQLQGAVGNNAPDDSGSLSQPNMTPGVNATTFDNMNTEDSN